MGAADVVRAGLLWLALVSPVLAEPVALTIIAMSPEGPETRPLLWAAVPMDLPPEAEVLEALVITPSPVQGAWQVALEPGTYTIAGSADGALYETRVTVTAQSARIEVPLLSIEDHVALRCDGLAPCDYADPRTGLRLTVPPGWAVETPFIPGEGDVSAGAQVSTVLFQDSPDGAAVWFVNPESWIGDDNGPCRPVAVGRMCTFEITEMAEAAFAVIAPSLRLAD